MSEPRGDPRLETILHLWLEEGATYQEIGDAYGITRERVRQILDEAEAITPQNKKRATEARQRRQAEIDAVTAEVVMARWRQPLPVVDIMDELGLSRAKVTEIIDQNATAREREARLHILHATSSTRKMRNYAKTDEEVLADLAWGAQMFDQNSLSVPGYTELREIFPERRMVTPAVIIKRFGSWNNAVEEAGLVANPRHHSTPKDDGWQRATFEEEDYRQALLDCTAALEGKIPSIGDYEKWRKRVHDTGNHGKAGSAPSLSAFRWRYGSWLTALQKAGLL